MDNSNTLCKYASAEGFKRLWNDETIRFTQSNQLNDPYENRILPENFDYNSDDELEKLLGNKYKPFKDYYKAEVNSTIKNILRNFKRTLTLDGGFCH